MLDPLSTIGLTILISGLVLSAFMALPRDRYNAPGRLGEVIGALAVALVGAMTVGLGTVPIIAG